MKKKCSKALALLLAAFFTLGLIPGPRALAARTLFADMPRDNWAAPYVYALVEENVINGVSSTRFAPREKVKRAQFVKMLAASVLSEKELEPYKKLGVFSDVSEKYWGAGYINWAAQVGIVPKDGRFRPEANISRGDSVLYMVAFAGLYPNKAPLTPVEAPVDFTDQSAMSLQVRQAVSVCQQAGIINGYSDGSFQANAYASRAEASKMLCKLLEVAPLSKDQMPTQPPKPPAKPFRDSVAFSKSVAGIGVRGVEFNPANGYTAKVVIGKDKLFAGESASSMVSRTKGYVAVNGAFFDSYSGKNEVYGTLINNNKVYRTESMAQARPTFAVDSQGQASIQHIKFNQAVTLVRDGQELYSFDQVSTNRAVNDPNDGTRMIYTSEYGAKVPFSVFRALAVDSKGKVVKVINGGAKEVQIPSGGFVLMERHERGVEERLFTQAQAGDTLKVQMKYEGSSVSDIVTALSCGPTLVKNGGVRKESDFIAEGFTESKVIYGANAKMAIGVKPDGTVVIAHATCTMKNMGNVMKGLGCKEAISLDGGASCALYNKGGCIISPGRALSNMLVFSKK